MSGRQMTFFVVGHRGMLGHLVARYVREQGHRVAVSDRRYLGEPDDPLIADVVASHPDIVINCAGITPHRAASHGSLLTTNALLPQQLAATLEPGQMLIHPSTDGVFDGRTGGYAVEDAPNSLDPYGLSKRLGELALGSRGAEVVVLRTSIVGPEEGASRGLLAWFLAQHGPVDGWRDHRWNGITTLAWAGLSVDIAAGKSPLARGIHHPTTASAVSKFELLELFAATFEHRVPIRPVDSGAPIDRTLRPSHVMPGLDDQLVDLRAWMRPRAA